KSTNGSNFIMDKEVLMWAELPGIQVILSERRMLWVGHIVRMHDDRLPKQILFGELAHLQAKHSRGGQQKRFKDQLKASLRACSVDPDIWQDVACDRLAWRGTIKAGTRNYEKAHLDDLHRKRQQRKDRTANQNGGVSYICTTCGKCYHSWIGLVSHLR
uniref:C2H2-type domain-containing protein n=1 Tax=Latimeria chalumnae TaxID=7897 RepID=H3B5J3_LATCH